MTETSIADAKAQFTRLIHRAERGEAVHITRRGKPVAVLVSEDEYRRLCQCSLARSDFWDQITRMREAPNFVPVDLTTAEVASWRDARPVHAFEWPE